MNLKAKPYRFKFPCSFTYEFSFSKTNIYHEKCKINHGVS